MKKWQSIPCHDCGASEGELHEYGCDMERCPFCSGQLISCGCCYDLQEIPHHEGTRTYKYGLTNKQDTEWMKLLDAKGRIPYLLIPNMCELCGEQWPNMFSLPDSEWNYYVIPQLQSEMLCRECYNELKRIFPNGWRKSPQHTSLSVSLPPEWLKQNKTKIKIISES